MRKKIYGWYIVMLILSITIELLLNPAATSATAVGVGLASFVSSIPIILFVEYGILLRVLRASKYAEQERQGRHHSYTDYGHDEFSDITDHINAQADMIKAQEITIDSLREQLKFLVDDAPILIQRFDAGGKIKFVNNSYANHFSASRDDLIGTNIFDFIKEKGWDFDLRADLSRLTVKRPVVENTYKGRSSGKWLMWVSRAIFDTYGSIREYQMIGVDITDQKEAETRLSFVYDSMALLTSVDLEGIKPSILDLMHRLCAFAFASRVRLSLFDNDEIRSISCCGKEGSTVTDAYPLSSPKWWSAKFEETQDNYISFNDVGAIETLEARTAAMREGITKIIVVPVMYNHTYVGLISIESVRGDGRDWSKTDALTARMIGRLIGTVLRPIVVRSSDGITVDKNII